MNRQVNMAALGEIAEVIPGVATRTPQEPGGGQRSHVLTVRALSDTGIDASDAQDLDVLGNISDAQRLQAGDVLLSARSTRVIAAVVPQGMAGVPINATLVIVRCGPLLNSHVLAAYLNHLEGQLAIAAVAQSGTAQINLTAAALRRLPVPVPPRGQQERLAALLLTADKAYTTALEAAERRRQLARSVVLTTGVMDNQGNIVKRSTRKK